MQFFLSPRRAHTHGHDANIGSQGFIGFVLFLFLVSCVFDPADKVLGLKVWLFMTGWCITLFACIASRKQIGAPLGLWIYTVIFVLIPTLSIVRFWLFGESSYSAGFSLLKGYLLITLAPMLVLNRIDLLPRLCAVLTVLAVAIIGFFIAVELLPGFYAVVYVLGGSTGIVFIGSREYGADVSLDQVYFVTSPMLVMAIAYYFSRARLAVKTHMRIAFYALVLIDVVGMLLAGTRNNIFAALLLPLALFLLHVKSKLVAVIFGIAVMAILGVIFNEALRAFLDPTEISNSVKLALLADYGRIFSDPVSLIFGQGLGAYNEWEGRGYFYVTELTYLEVIRNFGVFGALVIFGLLLVPVVHPFLANRSLSEKAMATGFFFFLLMCTSNPNLFSSMGILILSVALANMFMRDRREAGAVALKPGLPENLQYHFGNG